MIFLIQSEYASEEIDSELDRAIERMCELVKEWPCAFKLSDEEGRIYATAFAGDRFVWPGDTFERSGKTYGVACIRYFENTKKCPKCGSIIGPKKLGCEQCSFLAAPTNKAGEPRKRAKPKSDFSLKLPFVDGGGDADL